VESISGPSAQKQGCLQSCTEPRQPWADFGEFLALAGRLAARETPQTMPSVTEQPRTAFEEQETTHQKQHSESAETTDKKEPSRPTKEADSREHPTKAGTASEKRSSSAIPTRRWTPSAPTASTSSQPSAVDLSVSGSTTQVIAEVRRIMAAETSAEILKIDADADDAAMQKAWKRIVFTLHPDKLSDCSVEDRNSAADALHRLHEAKEEFRGKVQASGAVEVPLLLQASGRPVCTKNTPGQRRYECRWLAPDTADSLRPVVKYEVFGPRIFSTSGEPMEWSLLATLPRLDCCFVFVEESPTQQEVMWAADRQRVPSLPLTVYAVNGRGKSEALYYYLPWQGKFTWLQGVTSMICRQCCALQPQPSRSCSDKQPCNSCGAWIVPNASTIVIHCPKCFGEALWDNTLSRLDCRLCGRHVASNPRHPQQLRPSPPGPQSGSSGGRGPSAQSVPPRRRC